MRRAARTDRNHRALFDLAKQLGAYVTETYQLGNGAPDGFVFSARRHAWYAVEIKTEDGTLTPEQVRVHALIPVHIWRTEADVLLTLGIRERRHRSTGRVPAVIVDGYRRCALDTCRKPLPDEAHANQKYCGQTCNNRAAYRTRASREQARD